MKKYLKFLCCIILYQTSAQQVMLQGFYWDYPKAGQGYNWADTLKSKTISLKEAGFTHIWYPPFAGNGPKSGGYDPKDLFIGAENTLSALGTKAQVKEMTAHFIANGLKPVADMVYNHRDAGKLENNEPLKDYMLNHAGNTSSRNCSNIPGVNFKEPFPSDRVKFILPIGASTGHGPGDYYINIAPRTAAYAGHKYMFYATTTKAGGGSRWTPLNPVINILSESGGNIPVALVQNHKITIDTNGDSDELKITLDASNFNLSGDTLKIDIINVESAYANQRIWKIWYDPGANAGFGIARDLADHTAPFTSNYKLQHHTYTDWSNLPSGRGELHAGAFRPNWGTASNPESALAGASQTCMGPQWSMESPDYFYDYDHTRYATRDTLIAWTKWAWDSLSTRALRMDAIKHFETDFVGDMLTAMYDAGKVPDLVVGEWYGNEGDNMKNWVNAVSARMSTAARTAIPVKVFDFGLRYALKDACDNAADPRRVYFESLRDRTNSLSGFNVVTMVNNHDFRDVNPTWSSSIVSQNTELAYAYILTNNQLGVPTVFYPDYYGYPSANTTFGTDTYAFDYHPVGFVPLKTEIDKLLKVNKYLINGSQSVDYLNHYGGLLNPVPSPNVYSKGQHWKSLIYQLNGTGSIGGKEVVVAINFSADSLVVQHVVAARNGVAAGSVFTDVLDKTNLKHSTIDAQNRITLKLAPKSYVIYVQGENPCFEYKLANIENGARKIESPSKIESTSQINPSASVTYDAKNQISLLPGFKTEAGAVFKTQIDGCGNN